MSQVLTNTPAAGAPPGPPSQTRPGRPAQVRGEHLDERRLFDSATGAAAGPPLDSRAPQMQQLNQVPWNVDTISRADTICGVNRMP